MKFYENAQSFYQDRGGENSGEKMHGVWHIDDLGIEGRMRASVRGAEINVGGETGVFYSASAAGRYTVNVVADTGDVYAWRPAGGRVALLANIGGGAGCYARAEELLDGWAVVGDWPPGKPLSWFVGRLVDYLVMDV